MSLRYYFKPCSQVKVFRKCKDGSFKKTASSINANTEKTPSTELVDYYENLVKIQMLSTNLHKQLFPQAPRSINTDDLIKIGQQCKLELKRNGIDINKTELLKDVKLKLPPLKGDNVQEHFWQIGNDQVEPYKSLILPLANLKRLPPKPQQWSLQEGWTIYETDKGTCRAVDWPLEDGLVFDVEVCMSEGAMPTLATAVSTKHWYSWVSPRLACSSNGIKSTAKIPAYNLDELIPLGLSKPKLVIGHNVSYDRARIREQYLLQDTGVRFLDTMSLHVSVSGVTSYQRAMLKSKKEPSADNMEWLAQSSLNNLADVHQLYCGVPLLGKERRNAFVEGTLDDIRANFQQLVNYCAEDVEATQRVLRHLFPLFMERFPHPVTLGGMLEMGSAYLPVNKNWHRYVEQADTVYDNLNANVKNHLMRRAEEACSLMKNENYKSNLWLWDADWTAQKFKSKRKNPSLLSSYPAWYRKLCKKPPKDAHDGTGWQPAPTEISIGMQIVPKLLSLCWEGYPLHYIREHGWGFLVPFRTHHVTDDAQLTDISTPRVPIKELAAYCPIPDFAKAYATKDECDYDLNCLRKDIDMKSGRLDFYAKAKTSSKRKDPTEGLYRGSGVWCNRIIDNCCFFLKLPHKNGKSLRVGNPLSRDFLQKFSENILSSADGKSSLAARIIETARMVSYWRNNRERILGQVIVWLPAEHLPKDLHSVNYTYGAICPQVLVCGTLTRRAMEPTWMTASNSQKERIGSELRAMVQAPPGYRIVGADVDSQELWIASVLGDAYAYGIHGATPLGWMTLSGNKANCTDMHSITAKAVGISRDNAKVINYARIYGAGQNFAEDLLKQFNPTFSDSEARSKAVKMFTLTKGKKVFKLKDDFQNHFEKKRYTGYEALKLGASVNRGVNEMFEHCWEGGTESAMFNRLEDIATAEEPVTPFLKCRLSRALEIRSHLDENRFLPTRINWVVQSGAVDFLHLMLVSMRWLMGSNVRFCLSFHDELRYLVEDGYAYKAALAMHVTNLLTRSFCSSCLGLDDLPMSVAFFSSVEVDTVLRKECSMDCQTPSNPHGLNKGYGIPPGESLNIYEAIEKAGGNDMTQWNWIK